MKKMWFITRRKLKELIFALVLLVILFYFGVFHHLFEKDFNKEFHYPYNGDIEESVQQLRNNQTPNIQPINGYYYHYSENCYKKCKDIISLRLVYLIKSTPEHFKKRIIIRNTWGYEHRFSDVEIRTVFLLGSVKSEKIQQMIVKESNKFNDIIQGNFTDAYFNNTYKTMMGFAWVKQFCSNARFYMFVDDDYYVSTKNVLRFIRNPVNYPDYLKIKHKGRRLKLFDFDLDQTVRLYAGYGFKSSPHRHMSSKWYVSLKEYPYDLWPPYITAGAYILSNGAIIDMYYTSFYTKHFKFDDIYLGLLAYKAKIEPFHCDQFYFYKLYYLPKNYQFVIASHGYDDPDELLLVWNEQKSLGNA